MGVACLPGNYHMDMIIIRSKFELDRMNGLKWV